MRTMTKNTTSTRMRTTMTILAALSFLLTTATMMLAFFPATTTEAWAPTTRSSRRNSRSGTAATRLHGMSVDQLLASPSLQDWTKLETYNSIDDPAASSEYAYGVLDVDVLLQAPLAAAGAMSPITTNLMNTPQPNCARMESTTTVRQQEATTTAAAAAVTTAVLRIYGII